jgi:predicted HD phosphohydrolase
MTIEDTPDIDSQRAQFHSMTEGTALDWGIIARHNLTFAAGLPDRMLAHLRMLEGDAGGFAVDRLEHSLQTATRAYRGGQDDEYVVCALLHDIGDILGPYNHADVAAAVLKPFVSDANHWMVSKHGVFQGYYFFHHLGLDRNLRDEYADHEFYDHCATFCLEYDQAAFDPSYDTLPLEFFEPAVREVLSAPRRSIYMREDGTVMQPADG